MDHFRPTPSDWGVFVRKNVVLLVLGTKEVSDGRPFSSLAGVSRSFMTIKHVLWTSGVGRFLAF